MYSTDERKEALLPMNNDSISRILKTHPEVTMDIKDNGTEVEVGSLAAMLKEILLRNEDDLKSITRWIQSKKRLINSEAAALDINDAKRKSLLNEVDHLEQLRQQLLAIFLSQQSFYDNLMTAEREFKKRYDQEKESNPTVPVPPGTAPGKTARKKKRRSSRAR